MKKISNTEKLFEKELIESNQTTLHTLEYYKKVSDIIFRTNTALGRNKFISETSSSTLKIKIDSNAISSTTEI